MGSLSPNAFDVDAFDAAAFDFAPAPTLDPAFSPSAFGMNTAFSDQAFSFAVVPVVRTHATEGGRPLRRKKDRIPDFVFEDVFAYGRGVRAQPSIGRSLIDAQTIIRSDYSESSAVGSGSVSIGFGLEAPAMPYVIRSQINVTVSGEPIATPIVSIGRGEVTTAVDLLPEEIAALLQ